MRKIFVFAWVTLMSLIGLSVAAQDAVVTNTPILLGQPIDVTVTATDEAGVISYDLTLAEAAFVNISVRTQDATDPAFRLLDSVGRELIVINDNPASAIAVDPKDAVYDNTLLLAGTYRLDVTRVDSDLVGTGAVKVLVESAPATGIGVGKISTLDLTLNAGETLQVPLALEQGEIISIAALGMSPELDLRLNLRDSSNVRVATNDDNETFDLFLVATDPRLYNFFVPETQTYTLVVRPFSSNLSGDVRLVVQRHGRLTGEQTSEFLTGALENRQRTTLTAQFQAGEIIRLTARASTESLDPEILFINPRSIILGGNDDHNTAETDLGRFDARLDRQLIEETGTYEIDVTSVSGGGDFELEITHLGVFTPATEPIVLDPASVLQVVPAPRPTEVSPEVTAEPTSSQ